ncbi:adenylyltransferase/cytidyltransferase family protein [Methanobrevibacter olleyae]|uniref:Cytidyltransferase-related domain-containing protein n=1 Tax=Methanobrevibacter olleyae TaxID=294671 RepID=A0A126QXC7_METOL|nr:adenylyltransferase/cytidyltransferase family protein [Methanobrevibacter olleyae]AMK14790.1 cytidyltransferase-related domain-containing protein [Methanobrevibacter olleyae]
MISISADFDPVHKGHEELIKKAKEIADKKGSEVVIYMNKGYSANHAPFFTPFEAREEMALALGADKVIAIEGLHHRLILSYSVPIRLAKMHEDGVTDYITAADISLNQVKNYAQRFIDEGSFLGMPQDFPNRNVIRWYAINEFLSKKFNRKIDFHLIPEVTSPRKISGRFIRKDILKNNLVISDDIKKLLPKTTIEILEREIDNGTIPGKRNMKVLKHKMNTYSRSSLANIAYLNGKVINKIVEGRFYKEDEESIWASFRRADYGPVMTRLAATCIEEEVRKEEVLKLMRDYEEKGVIPNEQNVDKIIERAWYVAEEVDKGVSAKEANEKFRKKHDLKLNPLMTLEAGLNLTKFEAKKVHEGLDANVFIDKDNKISCEIKEKKIKIKTNLKLPSKEVTYLRYILDSRYIPVSGELIKNKRNDYRIKITIHNY